MYPAVATKDPIAVEAEVQAAYLGMFPNADRRFVPQAFGWAIECFTGHYANYQAVDARYHDLEHTLQGTLCLVRLLHGRHQARERPRVSRQLFELGLLAILLHDTGYLKTRDDTEGTGAKYTITHVARSGEFAEHLLRAKGVAGPDIKAVQNMIQCTGVNANLAAIPFQSEIERIVGFALGTGDLLGQMAAEDYPDKLPILYLEFAEAVRFTKSDTTFIQFPSARALMTHTPVFWEKIVQPKLNGPFRKLYRFLNQPYPDGPNEYWDRVEANIKKVKQRVAEMEPLSA